MRPVRPELPLHTSSKKNGRMKDTLNSALEKGLDLAGLIKTKTGSGDKESGYIIKSYTMLIFFSVLLLASFVVITVLVSLYFDVILVRRENLSMLRDTRKHARVLENELINVHINLEQMMDEQLKDNDKLLELRSDVLKVLSKNSAKEETVAEIKKMLDWLVGDNRNSLKNMRRTIQKLSEQVLQQLDAEEREKIKYRAELDRMGEQQDDEESGEVEEELEKLFAILKELNLPVVDEATISEWEKAVAAVEEGKAEMETLDELFGGMQTKKGDHEGVLEYGQRVIQLHKVMLFKQQLLDLYLAYKKGAVSSLTLLGNVENIAEHNQVYILYQWLHS